MFSLFTAIARKISPATEVIVLDKRFLSGRSISNNEWAKHCHLFNLEPQNCETICFIWTRPTYLFKLYTQYYFYGTMCLQKLKIGVHSAFWTIINRYWFWSVKTLKEKMPMITCQLKNRKRTPRCLKTCFNSFTWQNSGFCTITRKVNYQRSCTFVPESQREQ